MIYNIIDVSKIYEVQYKNIDKKMLLIEQELRHCHL